LNVLTLSNAHINSWLSRRVCRTVRSTCEGTTRIRTYALKGCQIGKLTQDPQIVLDAQLRQPLEDTFKWLQLRLKGLIKEAQAMKEIAPQLDADELAAMLVSVIQGGYVLASASGSAKPFNQAIRGTVSLLR
jgi:hypothetical protein